MGQFAIPDKYGNLCTGYIVSVIVRRRSGVR